MNGHSEPGAPAIGGATRAPAAAPAEARISLASQLLDTFMEEAAEMLDTLHTALETVEHGPAAPAIIEARRAVHTIKGGARMCGRRAITDLAHACEDLIGQPRPGQVRLPSSVIASLFEAEQELRAALAQPQAGPGSADSIRAMVERLQAASADAVASPVPQTGAGSGAAPREGAQDARPPGIDEGMNHSGGAAVSAAPRAEAGPDGAPHEGPRDARNARGPAPAPTGPLQSNRLAIDLQKVEGLVAKVTEIVANRTASHGLVETLANIMNEMTRTAHRLQTIAAGLQHQVTSHAYEIPELDPEDPALETYGPVRQLLLQLQEAVADQHALVQSTIDLVARKQALAAVEVRLDTELQGALLNMRLMPLSQLRVRLDQVVRSTARMLDREVAWGMESHDVALDKHVCDRLFEPLMHLLRNAIDHGVEPPAEREAKGKPRSGTIIVHATIEGNQAAVMVSDDGRGVNSEQIAAAAVARGLITVTQARMLSTREKLDLVFRPGFSTAQEVTQVSGRGMGMEIVREACTRMGGTVTIGPREGGGTVVTLRVPLSMSVVHCMVVQEGGRLLAIPTTQVSSVHLVPPSAISRHGHGAEDVRIGPERMPLYALPGGKAGPESAAKEFEERVVLVVPYRGERVALAIDEIVGEEDQIVKPLPYLLQGIDRLLGAVVLGNGTPVPVLNLGPVLDVVTRHGYAPILPAPTAADGQVVLVVDDSVTMRLALTRTLEHAGYVVETARDGQEALEYIRTNGLPNLITLDIEMPRVDGLEALHAIRHMPGGEQLPIFMLSSRCSIRKPTSTGTMDATQYFTKPYHDREFIAAVRAATGMATKSGMLVAEA